jgi:hypothetical protein
LATWAIESATCRNKLPKGSWNLDCSDNRIGTITFPENAGFTRYSKGCDILLAIAVNPTCVDSACIDAQYEDLPWGSIPLAKDFHFVAERKDTMICH